MENIQQKTLATIVLSNQAFIPILEKYGLDFCCRGKKTLAEACAEKDLDAYSIIKELEKVISGEQRSMPFTEMNAEELISYITIHHHFYVKNNAPIIFSHIEKVATKHGDRYPHMEKEEKVLFPRIRHLAQNTRDGIISNADVMLINIPVQVMEAEHDHAGQLLYKIRELTNNYSAPADACTTHKVSLDELRFFEQDLHQHIHLENNILFPMAKQMVKPTEIKSCNL